jgi:hypothetical protein
MQKEKRSFDRFQGIDKTWLNDVSAVATREFSQVGKFLDWIILLDRVRSLPLPSPEAP